MGTYTLTFDDADLEGLNAALANAPYRVAAPLIAKMNAQIAEARQAAESVPHDHMRRDA